MKIWDAVSGLELLTLMSYPGVVLGPQDRGEFSADGSKLLIWRRDGVDILDSAPVNRAFRPREAAPPPRVVAR
jgi:hypothetical protein